MSACLSLSPPPLPPSLSLFPPLPLFVSLCLALSVRLLVVADTFGLAALNDDVAPTAGFNTETMKEQNVTVTLFDVGGGPRIRGIWPRYYSEVFGIIFVRTAAFLLLI